MILEIGRKYSCVFDRRQILILEYFDEYKCCSTHSISGEVEFSRAFFEKNFELMLEKKEEDKMQIQFDKKYKHKTGGYIYNVTNVGVKAIEVHDMSGNRDIFERKYFEDNYELMEDNTNSVGDKKEFSTGAVRSKDADSVRYDLISPIGLRQLAETYAEGAEKYGDNNWKKGLPIGDTLNHLIRHIELWRSGDRNESHLAHAAWGLFTLMHFEVAARTNGVYRKLFEEYNDESF